MKPKFFFMKPRFESILWNLRSHTYRVFFSWNQSFNAFRYRIYYSRIFYCLKEYRSMLRWMPICNLQPSGSQKCMVLQSYESINKFTSPIYTLSFNLPYIRSDEEPIAKYSFQLLRLFANIFKRVYEHTSHDRKVERPGLTRTGSNVGETRLPSVHRKR